MITDESLAFFVALSKLQESQKYEISTSFSKEVHVIARDRVAAHEAVKALEGLLKQGIVARLIVLWGDRVYLDVAHSEICC